MVKMVKTVNTDAQLQVLINKWKESTLVSPENRNEDFEQNRLKSIESYAMGIVEFYNINENTRPSALDLIKIS
jgi:hypothetical protein